MKVDTDAGGVTAEPVHRTCWEHARNFIQHEDNLIDHRLTWLATSQSIFFAGYVLQFTAEEKSPPPSFLKAGIPLFGIVSCLLVYASIFAALMAWDNAHRAYLRHTGTRPLLDETDAAPPGEPEACERFQLPLTPGTFVTDKLGYLPPRALPLLFLVGWVVLLVAA